MMKASQNINIGENVRSLREEHGFSTDDLIAKMNELGYNWNRTTLFNVEHNMRRLQLQEAYDILLCFDLDPLKDMYLLCQKSNPSPGALAHWKRQQYADKLRRAWNEYLEAAESYERLIKFDEDHQNQTTEWIETSRTYFSSIDDSFRAAVASSQPDPEIGKVYLHDFPTIPTSSSSGNDNSADSSSDGGPVEQ